MPDEQPIWVQVGNNTLHGAIDYWQERALKAEKQLEEAFELGWLTACGWHDTGENLIHGVGSPAYLAERAEALAELRGEADCENE